MTGTDSCYQHYVPSNLPDIIGDSQDSPCFRNLEWAYPALATLSHSPPCSMVSTWATARQREFWKDFIKDAKTAFAKSVSFADGFREGKGLPRQFLEELLLFSHSLPFFYREQTIYCSLIVLSFSSQTFFKSMKQRRGRKMKPANVPRLLLAELAALEQEQQGLRGSGKFSLAQEHLNSRNKNFPLML